jgi:hypothetical protein
MLAVDPRRLLFQRIGWLSASIRQWRARADGVWANGKSAGGRQCYALVDGYSAQAHGAC